MTSITKRNRLKYKGVKWINTHYAINYKRIMAQRRVMVSSIVASELGQVFAIRAARLGGRSEKQIAISKAVINCHHRIDVA
jgi:hypothetical protein